MAIDCYFATVSNIQEHPNAEKLEIGFINGWQVIIPKNIWINDELGLFICPDATLPDNEDWATSFLPYLGKQNRVKIVKLRGSYSYGILVKLDNVISNFKDIPVEKLINLTSSHISSILNIQHYSPPLPNDLSISAAGLPCNLSKTDEENWESLEDSDLYLNEIGLVTKKMDGCSATYVATPDGDFYCCGRRFTYKNDCFNRYTDIGNRVVKETLLKYAKDHQKVIAVRGEITGQGIQSFELNKDSKGPITFNLYNCVFPYESDTKVRNGYYGQWSHFLEVNKELKFNTVPILGETIISKEILRAFQNAPASEGEGVVINHAEGSYKAKSAEYYSKLK